MARSAAQLNVDRLEAATDLYRSLRDGRSKVMHRTPDFSPPAAVAGDGAYLLDEAQRRYLDMSGGAAVSLLGHSYADVMTATKEQLSRLAYAHTSFFTTSAQEQLAEKLSHRFGETGSRVYFSTGGSEANETAIKMAWQYWQACGKDEKKTVISRQHSYHGNTLLCLSVSGNKQRRASSGAPLFEWPRVSAAYSFRQRQAEETGHAYVARLARELEVTIDYYGADRIAAFIVEPIVGTSLGVVQAPEGYLEAIADICRKNEILIIFDEVMCGSGRSGTFFSWEADGVRPDIVTLGKGIAAGYQPLAATIAGKTVADVLLSEGFSHGHTYTGHAPACATGLAVQEVFDRDHLLSEIVTKGEIFAETLNDFFSSHPNVGDIRGRGLFYGLELVSDKESNDGFPTSLAHTLRMEAQSLGLICLPGEIVIDELFVPHVLLAPPVVVEPMEMYECCELLGRTINTVLSDLD